MEFDVVVCNELPNTELYRVHFPVRKRDAFNSERQPRVRYKKNVRMMEVRLAPDVSSGSFDKAKAERFATMAAANVKSENVIAHSKFDEVYEGRAYVKDDFVLFALGYFRGDTFYINPVAGTFDMHRSLAHLNNAGKGDHDDEGEMTGESDTEAAGTSAKQIRVKFTRPETERQKKRREASALHREKLIASDSWIPMNVHLKEDPALIEKFSRMTTLPPEKSESAETVTTRDLVERGIICGEREQIDLTRSELLVTHQRIREMPIDQQVKAQHGSLQRPDIARLVDPSISRDELFEYLQQCAHLVQGVWVFQSEFLYHDLTAAHAVTPGKLDEHRADMWRCARDLALCLLDAGQKDTFYINPVAGTFDMHRSLAHLNNAGKGDHDDEGEMTGESDTEAAGTSAKQIRVKFTRPETERQKKRREASALHREKLIASDSWIPMNVHLKEDPALIEKFSRMTTLPPEKSESAETVTTRDLVERGIICGEREQIDLTRSELLVTHQRIREMPIDQQVKAQVFKSRVVATADIARLVDPSISRDELFEYLQQCAHLVQGVWVFQSEFLYHDLTAAHAVTPGKLDEHRADMWRCARDLALCLLDAGQKVTRSLLTRCFQINSKDAEDILSSFAVPGNRSWKLRITPDPVFLESPENAKIVLKERRYWTERFAELQSRIDTTLSLHAPPSRARKNSSRGSPTKSPTRIRRNSTRSSPTKHQ
ncbi:Sin-like protein [Cooperia oncophora]